MRRRGHETGGDWGVPSRSTKESPLLSQIFGLAFCRPVVRSSGLLCPAVFRMESRGPGTNVVKVIHLDSPTGRPARSTCQVRLKWRLKGVNWWQVDRVLGTIWGTGEVCGLGATFQSQVTLRS